MAGVADMLAAKGVDWSKMNQPMGELKPATYTPTQQIGNSAQDALMSAGASPYAAGHMVSGIGSILSASPLGAVGGAADTIGAKMHGDNAGVVEGMAGMIPGFGPEAKAAARIELNRSSRLIDSLFAKRQASYADGGPKLTPEEHATLMGAFTTKSAAQQRLVNSQNFKPPLPLGADRYQEALDRGEITRPEFDAFIQALGQK